MVEPNVEHPTPSSVGKESLPETVSKREQKSMAEVINEIDPSKVRQIMDAIISPFQKESRQSRRDILLTFGGMLFLLIVLLTVMAFLKIMDSAAVIFFYGTAFGYLMGFLTKFFVKD